MEWNTFEKVKAQLDNQYNLDMPARGDEYDRLYNKCRELSVLREGETLITANARVIRYMFENCKLRVDGFDLFSSHIYSWKICENLRNERIRKNDIISSCLNSEEYKTALDCSAFSGGADFNHTCPDWDAIMTLGVSGLISRLEEACKTNPSQKEFYEAEINVLCGAKILLRRFAECALQNGTENSKCLHQALLNLYKNPPSSLYEAMQLSIFFYVIQQMFENTIVRSLGRIDRLFYPFMVRDIEQGTLTEQNVCELCDFYFYKFKSMRVGANIPFAIGGRNGDGKCCVNDFTRLLVKEHTRLGIYDPKIHVLYNSDFPQDLKENILDAIRHGNSSYVFLNDDTVEKALESIGEDKDHAHNYIPVGCYEPCAYGKELPCTCNARVNLVKPIELVFSGGKDILTGKKIAEKRRFVRLLHPA